MTCCFYYVDFNEMLIIFIKIQKPHLIVTYAKLPLMITADN